MACKCWLWVRGLARSNTIIFGTCHKIILENYVPSPKVTRPYTRPCRIEAKLIRVSEGFFSKSCWGAGSLPTTAMSGEPSSAYRARGFRCFPQQTTCFVETTVCSVKWTTHWGHLPILITYLGSLPEHFRTVMLYAPHLPPILHFSLPDTLRTESISSVIP